MGSKAFYQDMVISIFPFSSLVTNPTLQYSLNRFVDAEGLKNRSKMNTGDETHKAMNTTPFFFKVSWW